MRRIFFWFLLFLPAFAHALTLSDLRTEVRLAVRDNPSDSTFRRYSDATLLNYLNEAQRDMVNMTSLAERTTAYILTAGVTYYTLPTDLTSIKQLYFTRSNDTIQLEQRLQKSLYDKTPNWDRNSGTPSSYWVSGATSPSQSSTDLRISYFPVPTRLSTGTVTIWYNAIVSDMSSDSDAPFDNRRHLYTYHIGLAYHTVMRIKLREGKADEAASYNALYLNTVEVMRRRVTEMPDYTPGIAVPGVNR